MTFTRSPLPQLTLTIALCWSPFAAAGIGVNPVGFGTEAIGKAGTDTAYSSGPMGLNGNTAGIARQRSANLSLNLEPHIIRGISHWDSLGNQQHSNNDFVVLVSGAWTSPLEANPDVVVGFGVFAQGGVGYIYEDLTTQYNNEDELSAMFGVFRAAPAIAWRVNDRLRLGLSASLNYSEAEQKLFHETSSAEGPFFGLRIDNLSGISFSWRAGVQYDASETVTLGLSYGEKTKLVLEGGSAQVNYQAIGMGKVQYNDAEIDGLSLPREINLGASWQVTPQLNLGAEISWLEWSEALGGIDTTLSRAEDANAPDIKIKGDFGGMDNFAHSVSVEYQFNDSLKAMGGILRVSNLTEKSAITPLNNLQAKWHFSAALQKQFDDHWSAAITYLYTANNNRHYTNTQLPLGQDAEEKFKSYALSFQVNYRW
ncbi:outer membrane protein transport protein [Spongiibacter taiwanensis]|uniref:OmpP1/FadL family transporter n=1 Tax=Spongiibacter taiwanensis TaxID=1748242 RepID=UPI0020358BD3|nr:outer membrane protein transport protein [Spongiibacter taiwanensis]USA42502.1 outer membrane protein transport protein [Spongiibacter taiwanensis]